MLPLLWLVMLMRFVSWLTWNASMRKTVKRETDRQVVEREVVKPIKESIGQHGQWGTKGCGSCRCMLWWTRTDGTGKHSPEHVSVRQRLSLESPLLLLVLPRPPSYPRYPWNVCCNGMMLMAMTQTACKHATCPNTISVLKSPHRPTNRPTAVSPVHQTPQNPTHPIRNL